MGRNLDIGHFNSLVSTSRISSPKRRLNYAVAITVQGHEVTLNSIAPTVVFDFGFEGIAGPASDIQAIWDAVPGALPLDREQGTYQFRMFCLSYFISKY